MTSLKRKEGVVKTNCYETIDLSITLVEGVGLKTAHFGEIINSWPKVISTMKR